jgi:hypothetical protein
MTRTFDWTTLVVSAAIEEVPANVTIPTMAMTMLRNCESVRFMFDQVPLVR